MLRSIFSKRKNLLIVILPALILQFSTSIQKIEAILTSKVYSTLKYYDRHLQYERIEFDPHFGEYLVSYRDRNGKLISFMIKPRYFPFIVSYDPLKET